MGDVYKTVAFSGNQIVIKINGKAIGLAQDLQATESFRPEPVSGLGSPRVQEYVASMYEISLSMSACIINNINPSDVPGVGNSSSSAKINDFIPNVSSESKARDWLNSNLNGCSIEIVCTRPDNNYVLRKYAGCVFESADVTVRKHSILMANARFKAAYVDGSGGQSDWGGATGTPANKP